MDKSSASRVRLNDKMVLVGLGLAAIYWFLDTFLFIFMSYDVELFTGLFGFKLSDIWTRIIVCCLFVIFGSHAQYTINSRKVIEETLREREQRYRTIIEKTEDGYYETDLTGKPLFANDALCKIAGYAHDEFMALDSVQSLMPADDRTVLDHFEDTRRTGRSSGTVEWVLVRKDGERRHVESSISLIADARDNPVGFRGFLRDVTRRKREEALAQEKMAAEAASKSKSEFLANMSHEIRTPLNSIIGLVDLLMESKLSTEQQEDLSVVKSAAHALLALINDILDFSKIEAGKLALEKICFNLRDFLSQSLRIMVSKAQENNIELAFRVAPDVPEKVYGDPDRFRQILLNLVGNAIKFTDRGEVIVSVEKAADHGDAMQFHFSVRDTGIGIPKDKQAGIFRTFEQADGSTSRRYGGTGLGLAVSSQLVELMGGRIWVESEPGKGSTFHFTVRFDMPDDQECAVKKAMGDRLQSVRALVVDDNETNRNILQEILSCGGMISDSASGTDDAIQRLSADGPPESRPQVLIVDADMPEPNGIELVRWIHGRPDMDVKTVMLLTSTSLTSRPMMQELGVGAFVNKPVSPPDLMRAVLIVTGHMNPVSEDASVSENMANDKGVGALKILVAEDTPFNQKFITRLLRRWGHEPVIAENGLKALEKLDTDSFDLILMDVQMPEMDGFEATQAIRNKEAGTGRRTPIVAMTAHAMKGDRERCLEAGMDDYVAKPIAADQLEEAIRKLVVPRAAAAPEPEPVAEVQQTSDAGSPAFDREALLDAFDHDWEFLSETVSMLLEDYPPMLAEISSAISQSDAAGLRRTAHALKGMVGNFQAKAAAKAAFSLEEMGRDGDFRNAGSAYETLTGEMDRLREQIEGMLERDAP